MDRSSVDRSMPRPLVALPCGSMSTTRTRYPSLARNAAMLTTVVVLPTPPFWLATATVSATQPPRHVASTHSILPEIAARHRPAVSEGRPREGAFRLHRPFV